MLTHQKYKKCIKHCNMLVVLLYFLMVSVSMECWLVRAHSIVSLVHTFSFFKSIFLLVYNTFCVFLFSSPFIFLFVTSYEILSILLTIAYLLYFVGLVIYQIYHETIKNGLMLLLLFVYFEKKSLSLVLFFISSYIALIKIGELMTIYTIVQQLNEINFLFDPFAGASKLKILLRNMLVLIKRVSFNLYCHNVNIIIIMN